MKEGTKKKRKGEGRGVRDAQKGMIRQEGSAEWNGKRKGYGWEDSSTEEKKAGMRVRIEKKRGGGLL